jgi:tRNA dimethylallyltransferase
MKKVIILLGPTGVGKTALSLLIAKALDTDIISADSMQVYRHMDIGTAKPSAEERRLVTHHMIDCVEPWDYFSAGAYIAAVRGIIESLHRRGKVPLVVGGTGLYIRAMTRGIFEGPSADWALRNELIRLQESEGHDLYGRLAALDPAAAGRIMPTDRRRIVRALEVCLTGTKTLSEFHGSSTRPLPYDFVKVGLTRDRSELYAMIEQRIDAMLARGLCDEVRRVHRMIAAHGDEGAAGASPSLQAIGYKEIVRHFSGDLTLQEAVMQIKKRSRNYARRQYIWFRKEEGIHWVDITGLHDPREIFPQVEALIHA